MIQIIATFQDAVSSNFQHDGNLGVKNSFGSSQWSSQTNNNQVSDIILLLDGQQVIRGGASGLDIIWSSRPPVDIRLLIHDLLTVQIIKKRGEIC